MATLCDNPVMTQEKKSVFVCVTELRRVWVVHLQNDCVCVYFCLEEADGVTPCHSRALHHPVSSTFLSSALTTSRAIIASPPSPRLHLKRHQLPGFDARAVNLRG